MGRLKFLALLLCLSAMYGCATVTRGTTDVLVIETDPPGAEVKIQSANDTCKTPCSVKLKRGGEQVVVVQLKPAAPADSTIVPAEPQHSTRAGTAESPARPTSGT